MNSMQKWIFTLSWIALLGIVLCPPWDEGERKATTAGYGTVYPQHFDRFKFLLDPPTHYGLESAAAINWQILSLELLFLGVIGGGAFLMAKGRPNLAPSQLAKLLLIWGTIGLMIFWCVVAFRDGGY
jgi:hypothetical protein